jgi:hypothetical protein
MNPILPQLVQLCLVMGLLGMPAMGATFVATSAADTSIYQNHPEYNLGGTTLVSGTNQQFSNSRALFSFDLSAVPADAIVTSVQVSLYVTRRPDPDQHGGPVNSDFSLYRALQNWTEGTGGALQPPPGTPPGTISTTTRPAKTGRPQEGKSARILPAPPAPRPPWATWAFICGDHRPNWSPMCSPG